MPWEALGMAAESPYCQETVATVTDRRTCSVQPATEVFNEKGRPTRPFLDFYCVVGTVTTVPYNVYYLTSSLNSEVAWNVISG